jgi:hypothetical protein
MAWLVDSDESLDHGEEIALVKAALHQVGISSDLHAALAVCVRSEGRHQHHGYIGELLIAANLGREVEAIHPRHIDVGDHDIDASTAQLREAIDPINRCSHLVPRRFQEISEEHSRRNGVLHKENRFLPCFFSLHRRRTGTYRSSARPYRRFQHVGNVEDGYDLPRAADRRTGDIPHTGELGTEPFHQYFLFTKHGLHEKGDALLGGGQHHHRHTVHCSVCGVFS